MMVQQEWTTALDRGDFRRFFAAKHWRLLKAALNRKEHRADFGNAAAVDQILQPFDRLRHRQPPGNPAIPRRIFMLWQQGWDAAPPIIRSCADSWQNQNPDWQVELIDQTQLDELAPDLRTISTPKASRQARSDIARLCLLARHGGIWADASLFCSWPLDGWLPEFPPEGAFLLTWPRPYRNIESWFIAAAPNSELIAAWRDLVRRYWQLFDRPHHYYWLHYLFEMLLEQRPGLQSVWSGTPEISAMGPLVVQGCAFDRNAPEVTFQAITANRVPVHKLSHKWRFKGALAGTPVGELTGLEKLWFRNN